MKIRFNKEKLKSLREEQKYTQSALADETGLSTRYIRGLELGTKKRPAAEVVCKIAFALDTSMDELLSVVPDDAK